MKVDIETIEREIEGHRDRIERIGSGEVVITVTARGGVAVRIVEHLPRVGRGPSGVGVEQLTNASAL